MGRITLEQAAQWCGAIIDEKYKDVSFLGACNDSRKIKPGQLFIALEGERDGHDYIPDAMAKGAAAVLCNHCDGDWPSLVTDDTRLALGSLAYNERKRLNMKVVAVTGSVGKSTTKEMMASVLETTYRVAKTPENHNNDLGLPMAILGMSEDTEVAVLEMGMNHLKEISYLSGVARPDLAVIINIGTMHIENLGSMENILRAKLEIADGLRPGGKLMINGDDSLLWDYSRTSRLHPDCFGIRNGQCRIQARDVTEAEGMLRFWICYEEAFPVELALEGKHYVIDAVAAVAVGLELGVTPENIRSSLAQFRNMAGRQEIYEEKGYTIIKDCYNAGPESMSAALTVLGKQPGRHVAVLGDMLELGVCTQAEHYRIGRLAAEKADILLAYGPNSVRMLNGAITGGMPPTKARAFTERERLVQVLKQLVKPGDVILFKGSRGMRMELALEQFLQE